MHWNRLVLIAVAIALNAIPGAPGNADASDARVMVASQPVLSEALCRKLDRLVEKAEKRVGATLTVEARTIEEARRQAEVPREFTWAVEYHGWFLFTRDDLSGGPSFWT